MTMEKTVSADSGVDQREDGHVCGDNCDVSRRFSPVNDGDHVLEEDRECKRRRITGDERIANGVEEDVFGNGVLEELLREQSTGTGYEDDEAQSTEPHEMSIQEQHEESMSDSVKQELINALESETGDCTVELVTEEAKPCDQSRLSFDDTTVFSEEESLASEENLIHEEAPASEESSANEIDIVIREILDDPPSLILCFGESRQYIENNLYMDPKVSTLRNARRIDVIFLDKVQYLFVYLTKLEVANHYKHIVLYGFTEPQPLVLNMLSKIRDQGECKVHLVGQPWGWFWGR